MWNAKGGHFREAEEGAHRPCCPAPSLAALDPGYLPVQRAPGSPPARPPFPLCVLAALGVERSAPVDAAAVRLMGSAPSPKAGGGAGDATALVPRHRLEFRWVGACQLRPRQE